MLEAQQAPGALDQPVPQAVGHGTGTGQGAQHPACQGQVDMKAAGRNAADGGNLAELVTAPSVCQARGKSQLVS